MWQEPQEYPSDNGWVGWSEQEGDSSWRMRHQEMPRAYPHPHHFHPYDNRGMFSGQRPQGSHFFPPHHRPSYGMMTPLPPRIPPSYSPPDFGFRPSSDWGQPPQTIQRLRSPDSWVRTDRLSPLDPLPTPHASGALKRRAGVEQEGEVEGGTSRKKARLYNDFSEPSLPKLIQFKVETGATKCILNWTLPELRGNKKHSQRIEVVEEGLLVDKEELGSHITSFAFKTTPGAWFYAKVRLIDDKGGLVAEGEVRERASFSLDEIDRLMTKAMAETGTAMQSFTYLYRCKPRIYWDDIYYRRNGIMAPYIKDNNGQAASPINGNIEGLFFSARTLPDGQIPPSSPFGDMRMHLPAMTLLDPCRINMYFSDFYCNRLTHYVTVVICEQGSLTDRFCRDCLLPLDMEKNPFLRVQPLDNPQVPFAFYVNKRVWVEIYYTENVPMAWGKFNRIIARGAGTSKIGGLPHNKSCQVCNLYPITKSVEESLSQPDEMVEDLVATYESQVRESEADHLFERSSTRYTLLGCVQNELLAPSNQINAAIQKEDYMEIVEVLVHVVDHVVNEQSIEKLSKFKPQEADVEPGKKIKHEFYEFSPSKLSSRSSKNVADARIEPEDDEITLIELSDDDEMAEAGEDGEVFSEGGKDANKHTYCPESTRKLLDGIVASAQSQSAPNQPSSNPTPLIRSLVNKVKALIKEMGSDFDFVNTTFDQVERIQGICE